MINTTNIMIDVNNYMETIVVGMMGLFFFLILLPILIMFFPFWLLGKVFIL